ncbi:(2,3-dihydroxybenzoyl)adenylate synthase [Streptomyces sp. H34-S4]|uniref:(2,3-dihydroxybenzoyl)adenylate synthase n=1 Tax=Streptomyces sp. H34-S4 TaxID=2996463 RepID=UPI00226EA936|nr:AMP-binding protein [Streptomyces sp. H34-S4]MCY0935128.1 AMP-binding protein [Streptomyces sp. H34-S4]
MLDGCTPSDDRLAAAYRANGYWQGENLSALLRTWAQRYGGKTALVQGATRLSYRDLETWVDRLAAGFREHGITPGDRVVVQLPNTPEFPAVCFALFRLGAVPVFSLTSHRASEIRHLCEIAGAAAYVLPAAHRGFDHLALGLALREELAPLRHLFVLGEVPEGVDAVPLGSVDADPVALVEPDAGEVAFFLLSGGTTALPKLIPRTHDDYAYQTRAAAQVNGLTEDDVYLAALPVEFNFTWGCPGVIGTLQSGGTVVLAEGPTADDCFRLIEEEGVTFTSLVPTVAQLWLETAEWSEYSLRTLRTVQIGGAPLSPELAARIGPGLGVRLQQVFGMAEGLISFTRADDPEEAVLTTQGRPISPGDEVRIVGEDGAELPLGATGELHTRGPYTLHGYYRAEQHNKVAFTTDGFYRTGDLARLTPEGRLVIAGRIKDVIVRGGDKVSAGEVEGHLLTHPAVARAAVIGVPDEYLGERICAFVVADGEPPSLLDLKQALQGRGLAEYKLPDRLELIDAFPLTGLGKVDKKVLAAALAGAAN